MCCLVDSTPNKIIIIIFLIGKAANEQMSALFQLFISLHPITLQFEIGGTF